MSPDFKADLGAGVESSRLKLTVEAMTAEHIDGLLWALGGESELRLALGMGSQDLASALADNPGLSQITKISEGQVVGHLFAKWRGAGHVYIQNIWVDPIARKNYAGLQMLRATVDAGVQQMPEVKLMAVVLPSNSEALGLFRKAGFVEGPGSDEQRKILIFDSAKREPAAE